MIGVRIRVPSRFTSPQTLRAAVFGTLILAALLLAGCRGHKEPPVSIKITRVPVADAGGPARMDYIEGRVEGARTGDYVVLYAHSGVWWVQPFGNQRTTKILADNSWKNSTHLGVEYAALLVEPGYSPMNRLEQLPAVGKGVRAIAVSSGAPGAPVPAKTIRFSGYDWVVRAASSDRGGEPNPYSTENSWTDEQGRLHLRMTERDGRMTCAEVSLPHSLGYGTYRFTVADTSHLPPTAVAAIFTWDPVRSEGFRNEMDIELSRWGNAKWDNAQYVVQPFFVPENVFRFSAPAGTLTHTMQWEPGRAVFRSYHGALTGAEAKPFAEHVFTSGVPAPSGESVHFNLYEFHPSRNKVHIPAEVVITRFEYLP